MMKILLYPFKLVYALVIAIRNFLYDAGMLKQYEFSIPIISVGNLTAGGTGKTPHAEYLISILKKNFRVAFLSRGYKRKTKGFVLAGLKSGIKDIGDEPVQIKQKFPEIPVAVCEKRAVGIKKLMNMPESEIDVIVLDDAFQHRSVKANINILLIDYKRQIFDDELLPVGRLRESASSRYRANFIIFTKCPPHLQPIEQRIIKNKLDIRPYQNLFFTSIVYGEITPAEKGLHLFSNDMRKYSVMLITGIANSQPLVDYLTPQVGEIIHIEYSDHYLYTASDIEKLEEQYTTLSAKEKIIITTEKDLVRIKSIDKLPKEFIENLYYIPIEIKFLDRSKESFNKRILNYVTENRSNSKVHKR
ncbi:tetraacyldisaccharide 4'-kinase [Roseimarinus sediminis]|uniref:tetraacyldisaccharide 4'-kinase n=1 Tax=Roseimarinus sediminis TaxID=1610899 RepID=UPI003D211CB4